MPHTFNTRFSVTALRDSTRTPQAIALLQQGAGSNKLYVIRRICCEITDTTISDSIVIMNITISDFTKATAISITGSDNLKSVHFGYSFLAMVTPSGKREELPNIPKVEFKSISRHA
jgi:hypothetical protein